MSEGRKSDLVLLGLILFQLISYYGLYYFDCQSWRIVLLLILLGVCTSTPFWFFTIPPTGMVAGVSYLWYYFYFCVVGNILLIISHIITYYIFR